MNEAPSAPDPSGPEKPQFDLPAALMRGSLRVVQRRALGLFMAAVGLATGLLVLTIGSVAAAWDTPYRWPVLLCVAGFYLIIGAVGIWLLVQPIDDPDLRASQEKIAEIRGRIQQWTDQIGEGPAAVGLGLSGFHPRSRTLQWVASLGSLPIPWMRIAQSLLLWRGLRRRWRR